MRTARSQTPRNLFAASGVLVLLMAVGAILDAVRRAHVRALLVRTEPARVLQSPALVEEARAIGRRVYERHCANCHGAHLEGSRTLGVPDLGSGYWLYGNEPVNVEYTIYYGIRSGHPKARNVTDMPAFVRTGQLTPGDAKDVIAYLESLSGAPPDVAAADRGSVIYLGKGNCYDCHAADAKGVVDYGTPPLTGPRWLYGGDPSALMTSVRDGRHGLCPAWVNTLTPAEIRSVAIYLLVTAPSASRSGDPKRQTRP
jgi:cytochrome c oxidase cbb3-type subunit III